MTRVHMQFFNLDNSIQNDPSVIQGDQDALRHPQRPQQAQPWGVQQVPVIFINILYGVFYFTKINRFLMVPRWSWCSRTPSANLTSSTKGSKASTSFHKNLTWQMFTYDFSKTNWFKTVPAWYRVIKMLLDTLSNLIKLKHGEFSKYQLYS